MSRWVLWVALFTLIPVPLIAERLIAIPLGRVLQMLIRQEGLLTVSLVGQAVLWAVLLGGISYFYGFWSRQWPVKVRGSVMSLSMFSLLILFASVPVYYPLIADQWVTFRVVYQ